MTHLELSADVTHDSDRLGKCPASPPDGDRDLCDKLQAYLGCRSRNVDPPATLVEEWDRFYDYHTPRIRGFLHRMGLPEADREDCLQEVWSEVVAHLADLAYDSRRGRLSTWLITVARNRTLNIFRRRRRLSIGRMEDAAALVDPGPGPVADSECLWKQDQVYKVLTELAEQVSELDFQVIYQRFIDGRTAPRSPTPWA